MEQGSKGKNNQFDYQSSCEHTTDHQHWAAATVAPIISSWSRLKSLLLDAEKRKLSRDHPTEQKMTVSIAHYSRPHKSDSKPLRPVLKDRCVSLIKVITLIWSAAKADSKKTDTWMQTYRVCADSGEFSASFASRRWDWHGSCAWMHWWPFTAAVLWLYC